MNETKPFQTQNFYELLEIEPSAPPEDIRAAYELAMEQYGPDSVAIYALEDPDKVAELRARIDEAWKVLGDDALRGAYDSSLGIAAPPILKSVPAPPSEEAKAKEPVKAAEVPAPEAAPVSGTVIASSVTTPTVVTPAVVGAADGGAANEDAVPEKPPSAEPRTPRVTVTKFHPFEPGEEAPPPPATAPVAPPPPTPAPIAARPVEVPPPSRPRFEVPPEAEFNGELLRRVRESRGLTLKHIAERTRIGIRHLENVEADRYAELPSGVYLRGILMNIARELKLDPLRVSKSYMELVAGGK